MRCLPALLFTAVLVQLPAATSWLVGISGWREILKRVIEFITLGGVALALVGGLIFLLTWVLSHLRRPGDHSRVWLSGPAVVLGYIAMLLTAVAAAGLFVPLLAPWLLKAFAVAIIVAAVAWCMAVAALLAGGTRRDLRRVRRALILAGTPWYCLALFLAAYL